MLRESAKGAAAQCSGGANGTTCGSDWSSGEWDGTQGLGEDLSALNVIVANLPSAGRLATVNSSAGEAGGSGGNSTGTSNDGSNGTATGAGGATTDSASSASHIAMSSMVLAVAVGSMMAFL